jgi:hypothetical protein
MTEREYIEKKSKILDLLFEVDNYEVSQFFDVESDKMLDDKIEVLEALKKGKPIAEIPKFYDVLELYPRNEMWD